MLITNGIIIIDSANDANKLDEQVSLLTDSAKNNFANEVVFPFEALPYPHYVIPDGVTFQELKDFAGDELEIIFKVIGTDITKNPVPRMKEIKHVFTEEEKAKIAEEIVTVQQEKEQIEGQKKIVTKELGDKITKAEMEISGLAAKYREGSEQRTETCDLCYDFNQKKRIYVLTGTDQVVVVEDMLPEDFQLQFNFDEAGTIKVEEKKKGRGGPKSKKQKEEAEKTEATETTTATDTTTGTTGAGENKVEQVDEDPFA